MSQKPIVVTKATVELTLDDGQTWRFDLDTTEPESRIDYTLSVDNDIADIPNPPFMAYMAGNRRAVNIALSGRGPIPTGDPQ